MLERLDLTTALDRDDYDERKRRLQADLHRLGYQVYVQKRPVVIVFEGTDAAGKGGAIKRLTGRLDPRGFVVWPIAAPSGDDKDRHYLYRFWRRLPEAGSIAIFDRSWYGRVLVERVEGYATEEQWRRSYREINQFERELTDFGMIVIKFWLQTSKEEQLRRFRDREQDPFRSHKIGPEDWRNRARWDAYVDAVEEMLAQTSTPHAPWTVIEANDKLHARVKVVETLADAVKKALKMK
jgi:polyphosphate kinase 2 (PPK2 family)